MQNLPIGDGNNFQMGTPMTTSIRLKAMLRHPANSKKRKSYRADRLGEVSERAGVAKIFRNIWAAILHPLSTERRKRLRSAAQLRALPMQPTEFAPSLEDTTQLLPIPATEPTYSLEQPALPTESTISAGNAATSPAIDHDPNRLRRTELHSELFDNYVSNSLNEYSKDEYVEIADTPPPADQSDVKLIAYYLPQFHPIPENDRWWGKGFTEWRNVTRAFPNFVGHYQPHVPGELGYYDLRVIDVMRRQVELAKLYGISAFCFHFYWFGGRRLLELPIENYLANSDLDLPFMLCWANENWSRRWDGSEHELLISQRHSPDDDIQFIRYLDKYFRDPRYLKIDGKPVLTVYRPSLLPNALETVKRWRQEAQKLGHPGLYLIASNSFGFSDYQSFGFDALSEFPPHHIHAENIQAGLQVCDRRTGLRVRSYKTAVEGEIQRPHGNGVVHPGVFPGWDNSARRPLNGEIFHGATPALFEQWLDSAILKASNNPRRQRLVFVNAWNEWAEGAHLEPDLRFGYANLKACATALSKYVSKREAERGTIAGAVPWRDGRRTILLCSHHLGKEVFGGERSFLDVASFLSASDYNVIAVLPNASNSEYIAALRNLVHEIKVIDFGQWSGDSISAFASIPEFRRFIDDVKPDCVYVNTIVLAAPLIAARMMGVPAIAHAREIISHDGELCAQIKLTPEQVIDQIRRQTDLVIANSKATAACFNAESPVELTYNIVDADAFDLPNIVHPGEVIFGLISSNLPKKGISDFVRLAQICDGEIPNARFRIIGPLDWRPEIKKYLRQKEDGLLPENLEFIPYQSKPQEALSLVNVVVNFSTFQESFGRTILEGMAARRPSIVYEWGALPELVDHERTGFVIPFRDLSAAAERVRSICADPSIITTMGNSARLRAVNMFSFETSRSKLARSLDAFFAQNVQGRVATGVVSPLSVTERSSPIDIVLCVHNALDDVARCLESIATNLKDHYRLIIVDDGSSSPTAEFLAEFCARVPHAKIVRNEIALGYCKAANIGLRQSSADFVILLNSDTIVTSNWADKLRKAVRSVEGAGIVGPLSNAASYQSIPSVRGTSRQTAVNLLPLGMSAEDLNEWCASRVRNTSAEVIVPLVHGFCFGITRETIDMIGFFDEEAFPRGYGEENDYCLRAVNAGILPVVALDTFVYHAKSKSYSDETRFVLAEKAQEKLYEKHSRRRFLGDVGFLEANAELRAARDDAFDYFVASPRTLGKIDDEKWLSMLTQSLDDTAVDGVVLPAYPDAGVQLGTVGVSGELVVLDAYRIFQFIREKARSAGRPLQSNSNVLDFGVGWGRVIRCFLRDVEPANLYGVDVDDRFLDIARKTKVPGHLSKIEPTGNLPYPDGHFDVVFAWSVFSHLPEDVQHIWLAEISRVLAPGGIFVASVQPPRFLNFIRQLPIDVGQNIWYSQLVRALSEVSKPDEVLSQKGFLFLPTHNSVTYGDTIISRSYVENRWSDYFENVHHLDDKTQFPEAVIWATKRR